MAADDKWGKVVNIFGAAREAPQEAPENPPPPDPSMGPEASESPATNLPSGGDDLPAAGASPPAASGGTAARPATRSRPAAQRTGPDAGATRPGIFEADRHKLPEDCPVTPLGRNGRRFYYMSAARQVIELQDNEHQQNQLVALFSPQVDYLWSWWPRFNKEGNQSGWDAQLAKETLMKACAERGVWDIFGRLREVGGWRADNGSLVFHCGDRIFSVSQDRGELEPGILADVVVGVSPPGRAGDYVYTAKPAVPHPWDGPVGTRPGTELLHTFMSWTWEREDVDPVFLLGWVAAAMLGGALDWRPMVWVTGDKSTGKSTLHKILVALFGRAILQTSETTGAGLWQQLGQSSIPCAIDEIEAEQDNRKAQGVIKLARQASSGGVILRGGQNHEGSAFKAQGCFLFSSINIPPLANQDLSRMAILELRPRPSDEAGGFKLDTEYWRDIGRQLRRRLIDQWHRWDETLECFRQALAANGSRGADQFGSLLACAHMLLADATPSQEELAGWARKLDRATLAEAADDRADWAKMLDYLMTSELDIYRSGQRRTISHYVQIACAAVPQDTPGLPPAYKEQDGTMDPNDAQRALGTVGLKLHADAEGAWLAIANVSRGLDHLFRESHWGGSSDATAVRVRVVRRVPGGKAFSGTNLRFDGRASRAWLVPLKQALGDA